MQLKLSLVGHIVALLIVASLPCAPALHRVDAVAPLRLPQTGLPRFFPRGRRGATAYRYKGVHGFGNCANPECVGRPVSQPPVSLGKSNHAPAESSAPMPGAMMLRGGTSSLEVSKEDAVSEAAEVSKDSEEGESTVAQHEEQSSASTNLVVAASVTSICLLSSHAAAAIGMVVGVMYPAYLSLKALEQGGAGDSSAVAEVQRLLTYWVAFALLQVAETALAPLLAAGFRHYHAAKVALLVWMHHAGARAVYSKWLRPLAVRHDADVERLSLAARAMLQEQLAAVYARTADLLASLAARALGRLHAA